MSNLDNRILTRRAMLLAELATLLKRDYPRVTLDQVFSPSRQRHVVPARYAVYWHLFDTHGWSMPRIGRFCDREASSVLWGIGRHAEMHGIDHWTARDMARRREKNALRALAHDRAKRQAARQA